MLDRAYSDDYFDGIMRTSVFYNQYGLLERIEIDTNHDNKPEIIEYYTDGIISKKIWYHESSKVKWKEAYFSGGQMEAEYIDNDFDGTFDVKITYNSSERPISSRPLH